MKKNCLIVLFFVLLVSGCGNTEKLVCSSTSVGDDATSYSTLEIKIKENKVTDMKFIVDMEFPEEYESSLPMIANNIKSSKPYMDVSIVDGKIRLVTKDTTGDSFLGIEMDQEITYGELKEVLELQDFECE